MEHFKFYSLDFLKKKIVYLSENNNYSFNLWKVYRNIINEGKNHKWFSFLSNLTHKQDTSVFCLFSKCI